MEESRESTESAESKETKESGDRKTENFVAEGYSFYTQKDMELAVQERRKIEYLQARLDYSKPETILHIYERAIAERLFRTPVGMEFLKELQSFLLKAPGIEEDRIPPISLYMTFDGEMRDHQARVRSRIQPSVQKKKKSQALPVSIMLNIVLVIAVIAMFAITLNSDQPNILNYERAVTDRYAEWEQQLTEREQVIREKERTLQIEN